MSDTPEAAPHVLVIEDDEGFAYALARYLTAKKLRVTVAHEGMTALEANDRDPADIVLLDIKLPDMSGRDVALDLKARNPDTPLVALTGYPAEALWMQLSALLHKPIDPERVYIRLQDLLKTLPGAGNHP